MRGLDLLRLDLVSAKRLDAGRRQQKCVEQGRCRDGWSRDVDVQPLVTRGLKAQQYRDAPKSVQAGRFGLLPLAGGRARMAEYGETYRDRDGGCPTEGTVIVKTGLPTVVVVTTVRSL